ncbi:MAG: toll/interleukin-1 receptor domain-containing protein [Anaerolineae bacterium]|nr:toll/interleukin-1 receptor domain-containing protein [Anaerolineae bacterium]
MASAEKTIYVAAPIQQVFASMQSALASMGATIRSADEASGLVVAQSGASLFSFGDEIRCTLRAQPPGTSVHVVSSTPGQAFAWGKNERNIETLEQTLLSLVQSPPANATPQVMRETPQDVRENPPNPAQPFADNPRVFISYRRSDSIDICGRIYDRLSGSLGREAVFKDVDNIPLGVDFVEHLSNAVKDCTVLLAVIGPQWVHVVDASGSRRLHDPNDFVRIEIESALRQGVRVVPVLVGGATMPATEELPETLQPLTRRNAIQVRPDPDFHNDMTRLIKGLLE